MPHRFYSSGTSGTLVPEPNTTTPDATAAVKGKLQLTGDLGGTAASPTVPGLAGKSNTGHTHPISDVLDLQTELDALQTKILFKDDGSNLGVAGDQITCNFTGAGVTASTTGNDMTVNIPGAAGGANIKQTEIDFGATPVAEASFLITDVDVSGTSQLIGTVAYEAPTGKDLDELEMDGLDLKFAPGTGEFTLYARGLDGYIADKFKINYLIG